MLILTSEVGLETRVCIDHEFGFTRALLFASDRHIDAVTYCIALNLPSSRSTSGLSASYTRP